MPSDAPVLEVRDAVKRFGPVTALRGVSFSVGAAEILALLGDNGAGKSTIIKALSGAHALDEGQVLVDGRAVTLRSPLDARHHGIETVYQDLALFDNLSVTANFFAGREPVSPPGLRSFGALRKRRMLQSASETLERLQVNIPNPRATVGLMSGGQRQAIAVARAVSFASRVVILDEPTAALGVRETRNVLNMVKRLPEQGVAVILISHNLEQVMAVADRAVVMRSGSKVGEAVPTPENHDHIVKLIVGAALAPQA
jgi:ABC-type sugar transport system ATPase subunit